MNHGDYLGSSWGKSWPKNQRVKRCPVSQPVSYRRPGKSPPSSRYYSGHAEIYPPPGTSSDGYPSMSFLDGPLFIRAVLVTMMAMRRRLGGDSTGSVRVERGAFLCSIFWALNRLVISRFNVVRGFWFLGEWVEWKYDEILAVPSLTLPR